MNKYQQLQQERQTLLNQIISNTRKGLDVVEIKQKVVKLNFKLRNLKSAQPIR